MPASLAIHFGDFKFHVRAGELHRDGLRMHPQEQTFKIPLMLLEHLREVVTLEEIRNRLCPCAKTFEEGQRRLLLRRS